MPRSLPSLSSMFPIPMSWVSPKILYLPSAKAITWVLPPEAYSRAGSSQPHWALPISMWAMQWLTPTMGIPSAQAKALAAVAATLRQGPRPGPMENDIESTSPGDIFAVTSAFLMTSATTSAWWFATSLGCSPPSGGLNMSSSLASTVPSESTMPTPSVCAVPSMPRVIMNRDTHCSHIIKSPQPGGRPVTDTYKNDNHIHQSSGPWSRGYDVALTWRRSPVQIRSGPPLSYPDLVKNFYGFRYSFLYLVPTHTRVGQNSHPGPLRITPPQGLNPH